MSTTIQSSYTWSDIFEAARALGAGQVQVGDQDVKICQMISASMYSYYPWKFTCIDSPAGLIPLANNIQDYARISTCYKLVRAAIWRTDTTPVQVRDIDVSNQLAVDLYPRSWLNIRTVSDETPSDVFRLEGCINVPVGSTYELRVRYQPYLSTITSLDQNPWFADEYVSCFQEGVLYKLWQFGQDARAGSAAYGQDGRVSYSGQLAVFMGAMRAMAMTEDDGAIDSLYPDESLGGWFSGSPGHYFWGTDNEKVAAFPDASSDVGSCRRYGHDSTEHAGGHSFRGWRKFRAR